MIFFAEVKRQWLAGKVAGSYRREYIREVDMIEWSKTNDAIGTVNRGNPAESGLCTLCRADCKGRCETFLSSLKGRKILYPRDFGDRKSVV